MDFLRKQPPEWPARQKLHFEATCSFYSSGIVLAHCRRRKELEARARQESLRMELWLEILLSSCFRLGLCIWLGRLPWRHRFLPWLYRRLQSRLRSTIHAFACVEFGQPWFWKRKVVDGTEFFYDWQERVDEAAGKKRFDNKNTGPVCGFIAKKRWVLLDSIQGQAKAKLFQFGNLLINCDLKFNGLKLWHIRQKILTNQIQARKSSWTHSWQMNYNGIECVKQSIGTNGLSHSWTITVAWPVM